MQPVIYVCGIHKKRMSIEQGRSLLYYMCPNHRIKNRGEDDEICNNFISRNAINTVRDEIEVLNDAGLLKPGHKDTVTIKRWDSSRPAGHKKNSPITVFYEVYDINEDYIEIGLINRKEKKLS